MIEHLNGFKKTFAFLNPTWAALKYFDEKEFLNIVQGEAKLTTATAIGKKPKVLDLPNSYYRNNAANNNNSSSSGSSDSSSMLSFNSFIKQQTNYYPQLHQKKSISSLSPSSSGQDPIHSRDSYLRVSAVNLSGSDILSCSNSTSESSFAKYSYKELPDPPCNEFEGDTITKTTTTAPECNDNVFCWPIDKLKPRPSLGSPFSSPNLAQIRTQQQQQIFDRRRRRISNDFS
jgi:hypothetical protein